MNMGKYVNQSERYGEQVEATVGDYKDLNPSGKFDETVCNGKDVIVDLTTNEVVAEKK